MSTVMEEYKRRVVERLDDDAIYQAWEIASIASSWVKERGAVPGDISKLDRLDRLLVKAAKAWGFRFNEPEQGVEHEPVRYYDRTFRP